MKQLILSAALLFLPLTVGAGTYSWTDPSGTVHFTDDIGAVPKQHRARALKQSAGDDYPTTAVTVAPQTKTPAAPAAAGPGQAAAAQDAAPAPPASVTPDTRFGDRTAAQWQAEFRVLRAELQRQEQQFEAARRETAEKNAAFLNRQQIEALNIRNKQVSEAYEAARLRFNQLAEQAIKAGLPPEFGQ